MENESFGYMPGHFMLSKSKIEKLIQILNLNKAEIKQLKKNQRKVANAVKRDDTQIAKVICLDPLLISCYSDEFDSVLIYEYPKELVEMYNLNVGRLLITSNMYWNKGFFDIENDILTRNDMEYDYRDAITFIPLFICDNDEYILNATRIRAIDSMVERLDITTEEYLKNMPKYRREGFKTLIYF